MGLDTDLLFTESISLRAPVRLAPAPAGGVLVVSAGEGRPLGAHRLMSVRPGGEVLWEHAVGPVLDLASDGESGVLVEALPGSESPARLLTVGREGILQVILEGEVLCAARRGSEVLAGFGSGLLQLWEETGDGPLAEMDGGGTILDIAAARDDGWWVLRADPEGKSRVLRLDGALDPIWERVPFAGSSVLAAGPGPRVWCVSPSGRTGGLGYGESGQVTGEFDPLVPVLARGIVPSDGGLLWVAPGALLRLGSNGLVRPGQGGFGFLVDVIESRPES